MPLLLQYINVYLQSQTIKKSNKMQVTNTNHDGFKSNGTHEFTIEFNNRFWFTFVCYIGRQIHGEIDIEIANVEGQNGNFDLKLRHESPILDAIADYVECNERDFFAPDYADAYEYGIPTINTL